MRESVQEQIGKFLNHEKLSAVHPLDMPEIEKDDIPSYITCSKYEKAKKNLKQKMERYNGKVDRLADDISQMKQNISSLQAAADDWRKQTRYCDTTSASSVNRHNHAVVNLNNTIDKIDRAVEKHDDLIDKYTEAKEEAKERKQELTLEALLVIDEDIVEVLDSCAEIVGELTRVQNVEDMIAAIEICMLMLKIIAMFEDLIEGSAERKGARAHIPKVNRLLAALSAIEQVSKYLEDIYLRNLHIVQKNAAIGQQVMSVLNSVDRERINILAKNVNAVLNEKINTTFEYQGIVDPDQLDAVIAQINQTIAALNQNIAKGNELLAIAGEPARTGVSADQQAKELLSSMKSNVDDMRVDILSRHHFSVQMFDEAVIDDFYHKDVRPSILALRQNLVSTLGEDKLVVWSRDDLDFFSLVNAEDAIAKANLLLLQSDLDKIPAHIKKKNDLIASANSDIQEAAKVPQQNSDALNSELDKKYIGACFPFIGWIFAIGILGRVKAFAPAFCSTNQLYKNLANSLLETNKKFTNIVLILGIILGVLGTVVLGFVFGNVVFPVIILASYATTYLLLSSAGKQLRSFLRNRGY